MKKIIVLHNAYRELNQNNFMLKADGPYSFGEGLFKPFHKLRDELLKNGYELCSFDTAQDKAEIKAVVFLDLPKKNDEVYRFATSQKRIKKILILLESKIIKPRNYDRSNHDAFDTIFTWQDILVDNVKYFKFFIPQPFENLNVEKVSFSERKFATMIISKKRSSQPGELYSKREEIINYFEDHAPDKFDLYGAGWDRDVYSGIFKPLNKVFQIFKIKPTLFQKQYRCYKGKVESKIDTMAKYKFAFAIENFGSSEGYITEKIFDCFFARTVPVYLGAPDVTDHISESAFINARKFKDVRRLIAHLNEIDEHVFNLYLNHAEKFLNSDQGKKFSSDYFAFQVSKKIQHLINTAQ